MAIGEQIDKISKLYCNLKPSEKKYQKKQHKRYLRRIRKDINKLNPIHNKYGGYIG